MLVTGIIWNELKISKLLAKITFITLVYGTYANWLITMFAAYFGTSKMTPIAGQGFSGAILHELIVSIGFSTVGLTMVFSLIVMVYGFKGKRRQYKLP